MFVFVLIHVCLAIFSLEYISEVKRDMKMHREQYMECNPKQREYDERRQTRKK